jgi:methylase of polypeptide subunit release factors
MHVGMAFQSLILHSKFGRTQNLEAVPFYLRDTLRIRFTNTTFDNAVDTLVLCLQDLLLNVNKKTNKKLVPGLKVKFAPSTVRELGDLDVFWLQRSNLGRELLEQVIAMCAVFPFSWEINKKQYITPVFISPNTYIPDNWTRNFLNGLITYSKTAHEAKTVVEIGVGTGIIPIALFLAGFQFDKYYGFDLDTLAIRVANLNAAFYKLNDKVAFRGGGSIFEPEKFFELSLPYADLIIANVPQIPSMSTVILRDLFDYYHMPVGLSNKEQLSAMQGLRLVELILKQSRDRLNKNGKIILNVGGRPGEQQIISTIEDNGYDATIIHTQIVEQDPETDISAFVHFEKVQNIDYEFYRDKNATAKISAKMAYDRISEKQKCYHKLYVIEVKLSDDIKTVIS